jgi:hypothetical protein
MGVCNHSEIRRSGKRLSVVHPWAPFLLALSAVLVLAASASARDVNFNRDIRPILADRCLKCHGRGEKDRKAHLRLDQADGPEGAYRTHKNKTAVKPRSLSGSQLWLRITSDDDEKVMPPSDSHRKPLSAEEKELFKRWILGGAKFQKHWSFISLKPVAPAKVRSASWRRGVIDPRIMAALEQEGLKPKDEADNRTLIRRVTFDLTGLPPSLKEVQNYLADRSPTAYAKLVDRLLKKPQYGEHMARYWADLVRLADTNGMHKDFYRNFSTYRDWLIRAFNENLPYDKFIGYQLAGDLYPDANEDQLVASGFNRLHLIIDRGTALPEESLHKNILDRIQAFGTAFLGLTVQCGQCHDHKYDPINSKEFYQLYAFFNNFDGGPETGGRPRGGLQAPFITLKKSPQNQGKTQVKAMVMREKAKPRQTFMLIRGAYDQPGEKVERGTPAFLPPMKKKAGIYSRLDLAQWLVDPRHPLTARVAVNRFWQQFFGVGFVKTAEDFGTRGEWPSHPQLLDDLSLHFMKTGWDVKKLVREIVLSKTYRQSSNAASREFVADPENRRLGRGSRYRMDAEMIRDQILFLSGKLNTQMYGPSVKPPQPPGLWKAVSMTGQRFAPDKGDAIYRRSFYTLWKRAMPPPQMTLMNAPSREFCVPRRERTNTPLQALLMMNEQEYFKAALSCAQLTLADAKGNVAKGLALAYEKATSHRPDARRLRLLREALDAFRKLYRADKTLTEALTRDVKDADFDFKRRVELAAWTMLTHSLFNLELVKVRR